MKYRDVVDSMEYVVVIEKGEDGTFSAYVPDLPGCVSCGESLEELRFNMREAVQLHVESLESHGEPVPLPTSQAYSVMVEE
jgi:predicted RNase H-like HicB family nuclease